MAREISFETIDTGSVRLNVARAGDPEAPLILCLHGFPEYWAAWSGVMAELADDFFLVAPDQRGFNLSFKPQGEEAYRTKNMVADLARLADHLSPGRPFVLAGHDWGASVAYAYAFAHPDRLTHLVIANGAHPVCFQCAILDDDGQRAASQYIRGFRDTANDALVKDQGLTGLLLKEVKWDRPSAMEPEEREALLRDWQNRDSAFGMLNYYRASPIDVPTMNAPYEIPAGWTPPQLPKLTIPTLVIWALDDLALPPENLEGLEEIIDPLTIVQVPDCGHFVPWEAPDAVNAAMEAFLAE
jgi:pimeloyl-ACP methyl ester carboxylesterase